MSRARREPPTGTCSDCGEKTVTGDGHSHSRPWSILCPHGHPTMSQGSDGRICDKGHRVR